MIRNIFKIILAVVLAILVFYIAFAWTASCRIEREMVRAESRE